MKQELDCTNIGTWILNHEEGQIFRYLVYKKVYTPHEIKEAYSDETEFENGGYIRYARITNVIETVNDVLLELDELVMNDDYEFEPAGYKTYRKLSDIQLYKYDEDNEDNE